MPTYGYHCSACGHEFDEFQTFSEAPLKKCPECKKPRLKRQLGAGAALLFKGSGFYQTDYRSESYLKAAKAEQGPNDAESDKSPQEKPVEKPAADSRPKKAAKKQK